MRNIYEFWKPVKGFEGKYEINNWGECRSVARMRKGGYSSIAQVPEKYLKGKKDKDGYIQYALCADGKLKYFRAHRLVAEAFIPNPNNLPLINHINGNRDMNLVDNLEWVDYKENVCLNKANKHHPIVFDGVWYPTMIACEKATGMDHRKIKKLLNNSTT